MIGNGGLEFGGLIGAVPDCKVGEGFGEVCYHRKTHDSEAYEAEFSG